MSKKRNVRKNSRVSKKGGTKNTLRTTKPLTLSKGGVNSNTRITTMNNLKSSPQPHINLSSLSPGGTTPSEPLNKVTPSVEPIEVKPNVDTGVALPKDEPNSDPEPESKEKTEPESNSEPESKDIEEKNLEDAILNQNDEDKAQAKIEVEKANELETQLEKLEKGLVKLTTLLQTDETQNDTKTPNKKKFIQALISITEISIDDLKNKRTINHWENTKNELKKLK